MEPTSFKVKEESEFKNKEAEFVKTKLMTRLTYTLDEVIACHECSRQGLKHIFSGFLSPLTHTATLMEGSSFKSVET